MPAQPRRGLLSARTRTRATDLPAGSPRRLPARLPGKPGNPGLWQVLVPVVALLAGLLVATTARTARGTDLRPAGHSEVADLIHQAEGKVATDDGLV
ncbi:MAG: hypothetical protein ACR2N4_07795, partial [Jatrophihabitans sp.]